MLHLNHKKLDVWKKSLELNKIVYDLTKCFPKEELFGLTSQLRRASVSVSSNISEGCSRNSAQERKRFFEISRSSLVEIDTQIEISIAIGYIKESDTKIHDEMLNHIFAMLTNLIKKTTE